MPDLARGLLEAADDPPLDDHRGREPGAEVEVAERPGHHKRHGASREELDGAECSRLDVVLHLHRDAQVSAQPRCERKRLDVEVDRVTDHSGGAVHEAGHAGPDRLDGDPAPLP